MAVLREGAERAAAAMREERGIVEWKEALAVCREVTMSLTMHIGLLGYPKIVLVRGGVLW